MFLNIYHNHMRVYLFFFCDIFPRNVIKSGEEFYNNNEQKLSFNFLWVLRKKSLKRDEGMTVVKCLRSWL